jgi:hypothetical protein
MTTIEQEPDIVPRRPLTVAAIAIAVGIAVSAIVAVLLGGRYIPSRGDPALAPRIDRELFEIPTGAERDARAAEARLRRYGWVDRERRIVHVPLDVATEMYLKARGSR